MVEELLQSFIRIVDTQLFEAVELKLKRPFIISPNYDKNEHATNFLHDKVSFCAQTFNYQRSTRNFPKCSDRQV